MIGTEAKGGFTVEQLETLHNSKMNTEHIILNNSIDIKADPVSVLII
jgi:hypothetical protein